MFRWMCLIIYSSLISQAVAQETEVPAQEKYTLSALVEMASKRSEWLSSLRARVEEKRHAALQARALQNPIASFYGGRQQTPLSEATPSKGSVYGVSLTQPFYFPGKQGLRSDILNLDAEVAKIRQVEGEATLNYDVIRLAYQYQINSRKTSFAENRKERLELIRSYLAGRPFPSPQQKAESQIVSTRLTNLTVNTFAIQSELYSTYELFNLYVGWTPGPIPNIEVPWLRGTGQLEKDKWLEIAMERNFNLATQRLLTNASQKEKELAQKEVLPDFAISAFYDQETAIDKSRTVGIGISLPLPLLNQNSEGIRSAEKRVEAEQRELRFYEQQILSNFGALYVDFESAQRAVQHYPENTLPNLEQKLKDAEVEFRKGRIDLLTFLELDTETAETYFRVLDSQYAFVDKLLAVLFLAGEQDIVSHITKY